ncbi:MAG TPA: protein kinase, partial [Candidatus Eisenbacteria bacterium]|nr:protein kinase [Candidatus Eisenbacteria bacterium]
MALEPHTRLGPYEILAALGAGGMGEVYRARDTRLGRDVAIKVLPMHLSSSPDFRARFEREAKTVSGLNHPNICTIHDVGREGDTDFLVMELIDGETLARRVERGPLAMADVLRIGSQIADALDRAHRAGVVHRDLKPGNVMLTKLGAKLMDFGLAREADGMGPMGALTVTKSQPLTAEGSIVGTFQYMAPERLEGKDADQRSDVWALGCVLYEMATGKRAFEGKSQASLISAIMSAEPAPIEQIAPLAPPALDRLVHACLAKDPDERIQTAHDVRLQLGWIAGDSSTSQVGKVTAARRAPNAKIAWAVAASAVVAAVAIAAWALSTKGHETGPLVRFTITPGAGSLNPQGGNLAISPDGKRVVYGAVDSSSTLRLWVRPLEALEATQLEGTENASLPFWSPDSRFIAFFADGKLKKVPAAGGSVDVLCDAPDGRGGTWSKDGVILFAPIAAGPIERVADTGGDPVVVQRPDSTHGETALRFPSFLPDQKHYQFVALPPRRGQFNVFVGDLASSRRSLLTTSGALPVYSPPYLVLVRGGRLLAQRFDAGSRTLSGTPIPFASAPSLQGAAGMPAVSISANGILVRNSAGLQESHLVWVDIDGRPQQVLPLPAAKYGNVAISADGQRAVVERYTDANAMDLWMVDLSRALATRFTHTASAHLYNAVWSPDGSKIAFNSDMDGP